MEGWYTRDVDSRVSYMFEGLRRYRFKRHGGTAPFLTIAREYGCGAYEIAVKLAERLNAENHSSIPWRIYDRQLVERVAGDLKITARLVASMTVEHRGALEEFLGSTVLNIPNRDTIFRRVAKMIRGIAWHGRAIIIGRGGAYLTADMPGGFHVSLVAPFIWRYEQMRSAEPGRDADEVRKTLERIDAERHRFYRSYFGVDIADAHPFDLVFNCGHMDSETVAGLVADALGRRFAEVDRGALAGIHV